MLSRQVALAIISIMLVLAGGVAFASFTSPVQLNAKANAGSLALQEYGPISISCLDDDSSSSNVASATTTSSSPAVSTTTATTTSTIINCDDSWHSSYSGDSYHADYDCGSVTITPKTGASNGKFNSSLTVAISNLEPEDSCEYKFSVQNVGSLPGTMSEVPPASGVSNYQTTTGRADTCHSGILAPGATCEADIVLTLLIGNGNNEGTVSFVASVITATS